MKILIGGAWPYANGSLHIGHLAGLLPADIIARYHRLKGDDVYYVSGSDCYGTPVAIRAQKERRTPKEISDSYHAEFLDCFKKLGFSFDQYGKTTDETHISFVQDFHKKLYDSPYITERTVPQAYCETCGTFLADRFVRGICPDCGAEARGDQCDACGSVLEPEALIDPVCSLCGHTPVFKESTHLFIEISKLEKELRELIRSHPDWRKNAITFGTRYIDEGLRDRAITRDLSWGIRVPKKGYEDKKIYIWAENVLGYLSQSNTVCQKRGTNFHELWGPDARHYYVHGKDNIPFHIIILPALLLAHGAGYHLPDKIISSEYLTLEGNKISTSKNYAIWLKDLVDRYHPDSLRYYLTASGPEKRDADFTWEEFYHHHNSELLGSYGNFVNRNLTFIHKYFNSCIPEGTPDQELSTKIDLAFTRAGSGIEQGAMKDALGELFDLVRYGNKYFDTGKPWETRNNDVISCRNTIYNCVQLIANLAVLLSPFLPFSSQTVCQWLDLRPCWKRQVVKKGTPLPQTSILFERLDRKIIEEERSRLPQVITK